MVTPRLISLATVLDRLSFSADSADIQDAVDGAIRAATKMLASQLRMEFDRATRTDHFQVRETGVRGGFGENRFLLSGALLADTSSSGLPAVAEGAYKNLDDTSLRWDLRAYETDVVEDLLLAHSESGLVTIRDVDLKGKWVRFGPYEAGLEEDTDGDYESVPDWLSEAAYLAAAIALDANPIIRRDEESGAQVRQLRADLADMIQTHVRYEPRAHRPIRVDAT